MDNKSKPSYCILHDLSWQVLKDFITKIGIMAKKILILIIYNFEENKLLALSICYRTKQVFG